MGVEEEFTRRTTDENKWYGVQNMKKWGITGMLVPFIPFALTQLDKYYEERSYKQTLKAIKEAQPQILSRLRKEVALGLDLHERMHDAVTNETRVAVYAKIVLVQSIDKVDFIANELDKCMRSTTCKKISEFQKKQLMKRVRIELYRQSSVYINLLNEITPHSVLGKVGDFLAGTFPMEGDTKFMEGNFMADLEEIIFMPGITIREKKSAVMSYMKDIQQQYFMLVLQRMNGAH